MTKRLDSSSPVRCPTIAEDALRIIPHSSSADTNADDGSAAVDKTRSL